MNLVPIGKPRKLQDVCDPDADDQLPNLDGTDCTPEVVENCVSKDLRIGEAFLDFNKCQVCTPGQPVTAPLVLRLINKTGSKRTSFGYTAILNQTLPNGTEVTCIDERCGGPIEGNTADLGLGNITFICGSQLVLQDILQYWSTANKKEDCRSYDSCVDLDPKCDRPLDPIIINTILSVSVKVECEEGKDTVTASIASLTGGTGTITSYEWRNADDEVVGREPSLSGLPDNTKYTLTVTDSDGCTASDSDGDSLICCFFEATCKPLTDTLGPCSTASDVPFYDQIDDVFVYTGVPCSSLKLTNTSLTFPNCPGTTVTRNYTLTDEEAVDGSLTCTQNVVINPRTTPPVIAGVGDDVTAECPNCTVNDANRPLDGCFSDQVTALDECNESVNVVRSSPAFVAAGCGNSITGTWKVTWTATDRCNSSLASTANQKVKVEDTIDPVIQNLDDVTVQCPACRTTGDNSTEIPTLDQCFGKPMATDACDAAAGITTNVMEDGSDVFVKDCGPSAGTWTRKWKATDACGNSGTDSTSDKNVIIEDKEKPVLTCPAGFSINACDAAPVPENVTAIDECEGPLQANGDNCCADRSIFGLKRTYSVTDECGNYNSCDQEFPFNENNCPTPGRE